MRNNLEKFRPLLMGLVNGKLTAKEAIAVNKALIRSVKLREEYERLLETEKKLDTPSFMEPTDKIVCKISQRPSIFPGCGSVACYRRLCLVGGLLSFPGHNWGWSSGSTCCHHNDFSRDCHSSIYLHPKKSANS